MDGGRIILLMLAVCGVLTGIIIMSGPIKAFIKLAFNCAVGAAAIYGINFVLGGLGLKVGINIFTAAVSGILGLPGVAALYAVKFILG